MKAPFPAAPSVNPGSRIFEAVSRRTSLILLSGFLLLGLTGNVARAQSDRERRREFVEGLLRTFVEAQIERHVGPRHPHPPHVKPARVSPDMNKARATLAGFSEESRRLLSALHADAGRVSTPRRHMGNAFRVNAAATALANQAAASGQLGELVEDVRILDREWRLMSHRLQQVEGLGEACRRSMQQLDRYDRELCALFGIQPQIDYRELLRTADSLATDLRYLVQDIEVELGRSSKYRVLVLEGRRVEQQARYLADAIEEERPYDAIVVEFKKFHSAWQAFAAKLWTVNNRYLERSMRRIEEVDRQMHGLLLLPRPIDHRHLQHLTEVLTARVDDLFNKVTLSMLVELPGTENVLNTAGEFYGVCQHFADETKAKSPPEQLREEFQWIEEAWPALSGCFRNAKNAEVVNLLKEIEQTFLAMRDALYIQTVFDIRIAIQLAASLESLTEHLEADLRQSVANSSRYQPSFRAQAMKCCTDVKSAAHQLHEDLTGGRELAELRSRCDDLSRNWAHFCDAHVAQLQANERLRLGRQVMRVTSTVVELQTMFE